MGNLRANLTIVLIISMAQSCAYLPRKVTVIDCINLAGEVYAAYCLKQPKKEIYHEKSKQEFIDEITKSYAQEYAKKYDPKGEIFNVASKAE